MKTFPLWTAMVTPMNTDGSIDFDSFETLLKKQELAGNGVLVLGSTGEGLNLNEEEKREVVTFTKGLDLNVPMMVGVGGFDLPAQADFIHFCNEIEPDALLLVTPLYAKPGAEGQFEWFSELMGETEIPCMLYNVPSRTGVKMHPSVPARLSEEFDHLMGVKEASGSVEEFKEFRRQAPKVEFYSGDDGLTPAFSKEGGVGLVSVASNVWPEATHKYTERCLQGKTDDLFPLWKNATDVLFKAPNPVPAKVLLNRKGWIENDTVRLPLSLGDISESVEQELLKADQKIANWLAKQ
ncbi:4-hydroxy-tetrahydrodipicolinate synthase [Gracilimonas amylolytica]|uniref:4-hydroxy-tetrahydrodipicolinate synthase n=1 Tax=Gracilimonas amylolytica TaxID=1749045 RepID=UPI000CD98CB0|nr:4-hydroxy-tetrahydrodipicolinate synthase [Gracilimonas amylolytica]